MRTLRALSLALVLASCASAHVGDAGVGCRWSAIATSPSSCGALASSPPCSDWAASLATNGTALARCANDGHDGGFTAGEMSFRCASADRCDGLLCWCGREPECASGSACMLVAGQARCIGCEH